MPDIKAQSAKGQEQRAKQDCERLRANGELRDPGACRSVLPSLLFAFSIDSRG